MKKIHFLLMSIIGLNTMMSSGFANTHNDHHKFVMTADRSFQGWEIGGTLLYLQPGISSDLLQFAVVDPITPEEISVEDNKVVDIDYEYGFDVFGRYYFHNGRDLTLRYTHLNGSSDDSQICDPSLYSACTAYPSDQPFNGFTEATVETQFNSLDLLLGQRIRIGDLLKLRLFAGLTAAKIKSDIEQHFEGVFGNFYEYDYDSNFEGIGPKVGIDTEYQLGILPFSLYMAASGAGLIGESEAKATEDVFTASATPPFVETEMDSDDQQMLVPNINVDLGLRYQYAFTSAFAGAILVGYRVSEYFNAVRHVVEYNQGTAQVDDTADFSLNGPYLELSAFF